MFQRNLLTNEIEALQINNELEFEVKKNSVEGHVAWAKTILNKLLGSALAVDNQPDENFRKALAQFQSAHQLNPTSKLDFPTERRLLEENGLANLSAFEFAKKSVIIQARTRIENWTNRAVIPDKKKHLILNQFRDPRLITALVLHHMAYKAMDKNRRFSNPQTYLAVGAHFCIMLDGRIMQHHPVSRFIWHSNCTSPRSVGVEFEGNFPDLNGRWWYPTDPKTKQKKKINEDQPTQAQFESGRFLLNYLKLTLGIKNVLAHRQSSEDRENDPGPAIWFNVGEWGLANLGLGDGGKDFKCGTGKPILDAWRRWNQTNYPSPPAAPPAASAAASPPTGDATRRPEQPPAGSALARAVSANRMYGERLGWYQYIHQINDLLLPYSGLSNVSLGEEAFAGALKEWQKKQRLDDDGVLGPKTWAAMKKLLKPEPGTTESKPSSPAPSAASSGGVKIRKVSFTEEKLKKWKALEHGVGVSRTVSFTPPQQPDTADIALACTGEAEGGFDSVNIYDRGILSWGISQWTLHQGSLQKILYFIKTKLAETGQPALWNNLFGGLDVQKRANSNEVDIVYQSRKYVFGKDPNTELRMLIRGNPEKGKYDSPTVEYWAKTFALAGRAPVIQKLQTAYAKQQFYNVVNDKRVKQYLEKSPLSQVLYYAMWVQNPRDILKLLNEVVDEFKLKYGTQNTSQWGLNWRREFEAAFQVKLQNSPLHAWGDSAAKGKLLKESRTAKVLRIFKALSKTN